MDIANTRDTLKINEADLTESRFHKAKLAGSVFDDVSLRGALFNNVDLGSVRFTDVNLAGATVSEANLTEARFEKAKLAGSVFDDVSLRGALFNNVDLGSARFTDVNLAGASIQGATLADATINGILVTDLLRAFENPVRIVLYAKHLARLQAFYQGVLRLTLEHAAPDHVSLASPGLGLVIVQAPEAIAATIVLADPPRRRTDTPLKAVFDVDSLAAARALAAQLGGVVDAAEREWVFAGHRVCDGHDPEGNVLQFRQRASEAASS